MWPPFFPHPPAPSTPPAEPPIELGRCRYCESMTSRQVCIAGLEVAYVCPRKACCEDYDREVRP